MKIDVRKLVDLDELVLVYLGILITDFFSGHSSFFP